MVSFSCEASPSCFLYAPLKHLHFYRDSNIELTVLEGCGDVLTKKKLDPHRNQCYGASFTCLDCMVHFQGTEYRAHTVCLHISTRSAMANKS